MLMPKAENCTLNSHETVVITHIPPDIRDGCVPKCCCFDDDFLLRFICLGLGLQPFLKVNATLTLREVILRHDN